jgi:hypothetical protein
LPTLANTDNIAGLCSTLQTPSNKVTHEAVAGSTLMPVTSVFDEIVVANKVSRKTQRID